MSEFWLALPALARRLLPQGLRQKDELGHAAERMSSVEINGSFYSLQRPTSYEAWRDATLQNFASPSRAAGSSPTKQLHDGKTPLANFFASGCSVRDKLGPILWQLPARTRFDPDRLVPFSSSLPRTTTAAAELAERHDNKILEGRAATKALTHQGSVTPRATPRELRHRRGPRVLAEHDICTVVADSAGRWPQMHDATSDFRYVRLHGESELYASGYTDESPTAGPPRSRAGSPTATTPMSTSTMTPRATPLTTPSPSAGPH